MSQPEREQSMEEILEQVQREYAEQAKQAKTQTSSGAQDAAHNSSNGAPDAPPNWERLTRADVEQAKRRVARERESVLSRQTAELKELDTEQHAIEELERLIAAFAEKHGGAAEPEA